MTSQEETATHELRLGEDIEQLGLHLTKMCVTGDKLFLYNEREKPFEIPYDAKDLQKTVDAAIQVLIDSHEFDDKRKKLETFAVLLSDRLIELKRGLLSEEESVSQDKESSPHDSNPIDIALDLMEEKKARENDMRTLHIRAAAFLDTETRCDENVVFYDLCNNNWEVVRITRNAWKVEPIEDNYKQVLFKRFSINNPQVYPNRDYPSDIIDQFIKLTNVHGDENNRLLVEVYLVSLFLLPNLPKPMLVPHGLHGSGKSTFHEFIKLVVDPAAALTTAFPRNTEELVQALSHSYLIFFDNVSEMSEFTSNQLCRAVTGSGFTKRGLYTNDDDFIYNMKRAVGYNGINITATRTDLLDRIVNIQLKRIDKHRRETVELLTKELIRILPYILGYIFDVIVKVLNRMGEVKLVEKPRMADFAKMGELIARCLGYEEGKFTEVYNANIGLTNEEAISANPVATAIIHLINTMEEWDGFSMKLLSDLNVMIKGNQDISWISESKEWPKGPTALSHQLTEVIPNLADIGIIVDREFDSHTRTYKIFIKRQQAVMTGLADADDRSKPKPEGIKNEEGI